MATSGLPSFFKVLVHDFKFILRIPPLFVKTFESIFPGDALLQTKSGQIWSVKTERIDERYCFTVGWHKFVKDLELKKNDFLVFWPMLGEKIIFRVAIYGITGCEKELISATTSHEPSNFEPEVIELDLKVKTRSTRQAQRSNYTTQGSNRRKPKKIVNHGHNAQISHDPVEDGLFTKVLNKDTRSRMVVPRPFAKKTGVICKREVTLQYLNGWSTTVALKFNRKCARLDICGSGWPEFRMKNNLLEGYEYAFQFIPETDTILVQDVDKNLIPLPTASILN